MSKASIYVLFLESDDQFYYIDKKEYCVLVYKCMALEKKVKR